VAERLKSGLGKARSQEVTMRRIGGVLLGLGAFGLAVNAYATMPIQKEAKAAGVAAATCKYCHGEALPKKTAFTLNERGKWLMAEKDKRKAEKIDGAWLKDYVEPAK
jgi:hypothetical protein